MMLVNFLNRQSIAPQNYNRNYQKQVSYKNTVGNDVFVKSSNVSFKGASSFSNKFEPFLKDFNEYYRANTDMQVRDLRGIINKYLPNLKLQDLSEASQKNNVHDRTVGYFKDEILFTADGKCINGEKALLLNLRGGKDKDSRLALGQSLVHEMAHAFQEHSSDRVSKFDWMSDFLSSSPNNDDKFQTLMLMPKFFQCVEYNMNLPIIQAMGKSNHTPQPIMRADKDIVNYVYQNSVGMNVNNFTDVLVNKTAQHLGMPQSRHNQKKLLEYLALVADKEREAYSKQVDFAKQQSNINSPTDMDLLVRLYEMFSERCNTIVKQF